MKAMLNVSAALCLLAAAGAATALSHDDVAREGTGQRRSALDAMELKPFPAGAWGGLTAWTNGEALSADNTAGKVVVVVTWKSWYKPSHEALRTAQQVQSKFAQDGVIVVAVHDKEGYDNAAKVMSDKGATVLSAHDATNSFREAISVDQDPDFYVIDRAGNLRYADIPTNVVEGAVAALAKETAEQAANLPKDLADKAAAADAASRRSKPVADDLRPGQVLDVPFTAPPAEAYTRVHWPEQNNETGGQSFQGKSLPTPLGTEKWITDKPAMSGRVVVLDFWATWCGPCIKAMPGLDALQRSQRQDLVIVGMSGQSWGRPTEDVARVKTFLASHKSAYAHANDPESTVCKALGIQGIPHVVVLSTDGVIRWQGNPHDPKFRKAVEQVIKVDPGVKARRDAEAQLQKSKGG